MLFEYETQEFGGVYNPSFLKQVRRRQEAQRRKEAAEQARTDQIAQITEQKRRKAEWAARLREQEAAKRLTLREAARAGNLTRYESIEVRARLVFGVTRAELRGTNRRREIAFARQFICYWAKRRTSLSLKQIGTKLGNRDHATILHGIEAYPAKRSAMGRTLRKAR